MRTRPAGWQLGALLAMQAALYFWNLGLLSPWTDEANILRIATMPFQEGFRAVTADVHPPLYFFLLFLWLRLPLGLEPAVEARALSVILALASTVAVDRLWARQLTTRARAWYLALWTLSPCLLLYARMCRSYSLQVLLAVLTAAAIMEFAKKTTLRGAAALSACLASTLYTHYVPGLAFWAAANIVLLRQRRVRDAAATDAIVAIACAPWLWYLARSLGAWVSHPAGYAVTGTPLRELPVKLAYWSVSFVMGEAVLDAVLFLGAVSIPLIAILVMTGARASLELARIAVPAALIGFIGVSRWVSYPFIPARMLYVFPLFLLLLISGAMVHRRTGDITLTIMLVISITGVWCYFHKVGFRNKQYPMPMREIAALIERNSAETAGILVDATNSDPPALAYWLSPEREVLRTDDRQASAAVARLLGDPRARTIWFLRNTHDVSAARLDEQFEGQLRAAMPAKVYWYEPFSALETGLMRAMGMRDPPRYFHELLQFQR